MVHKSSVLNLGAHILNMHIGFSTVSVWSRFTCLLYFYLMNLNQYRRIEFGLEVDSYRVA